MNEHPPDWASRFAWGLIAITILYFTGHIVVALSLGRF